MGFSLSSDEAATLRDSGDECNDLQILFKALPAQIAILLAKIDLCGVKCSEYRPSVPLLE
jgi:hypothetical protein